jgi:hypothetical protein
MPIPLQIGIIVVKVSFTDFTLGDTLPSSVVCFLILLSLIDEDTDLLNIVDVR